MNTHVAPTDEEDIHGYYKRMQSAVEELLILKGIFTQADVDQGVQEMDARDYRRGAKVVARAWVDPAYKARLLTDARQAVLELGYDTGPLLHLVALENTPQEHNVIVCTLCSCYPRLLLGLPPAWYKSKEYRSRVVREPRKVLEEFGLALPAGTRIRVHDSSADMRYMVLPMRPAGTAGWNEERLAGLVTRDCLIGAEVPKVPG